jgi:uncharacterized protein (TIGR02453 family)
MSSINKETLRFLKELKANNDRNWFLSHKEEFVAANGNFIDFVQGLIGVVGKFDNTVAGLDARECVFRIYRDTRFAKDKTPYKTFLSASLLGKGKGCGIAGYYLHLEPSKSFLAGGVHLTEAANLKSIREEISGSGGEFLKIVNDKTFKNNFTIEGEKLARVPGGFDNNDPMADYLRHKELMIRHPVEDKKVLLADFTAYCAGIFKTMVPLNSFMNQAIA